MIMIMTLTMTVIFGEGLGTEFACTKYTTENSKILCTSQTFYYYTDVAMMLLTPAGTYLNVDSSESSASISPSLTTCKPCSGDMKESIVVLY